MAGNVGAILAGLAGGARSLAGSMDENEKEAERKKLQVAAAIRQLSIDTLNRQKDLGEMGAIEDTGAVTQGDMATGLLGSNMLIPTGIGGADAGAAGAMRALTGAKQTEAGSNRFALPDLQTGAPTKYRIDEQQTPAAKAMRALTAKSNFDRMRDEAKPEIFGTPFEATDPQGKPVLLERGNRGTNRPVQGFGPKAEAPLTTYQRATLEQGERRLAKSGQAASGKLPAPAIEKMIELDAVDSLAATARLAILDAVKAKRSVGGRALGVVPIAAWIRNNITKEGGEKGATGRNLLGDLTSQIGKMRSGGAITPQEFNRLDQFLPNANDDESTMLIKLKNLRATFADIKRIRIENYKKYGGVSGGEVMTQDGNFGGVVLEPPPED